MLERMYQGSEEQIFEEYVWHLLPDDEAVKSYSPGGGRPIHNPRTMMGLLVFMSLKNETFEQIVVRLASNSHLQRALHIYGANNKNAHVCPRCLKDFDRRMKISGTAVKIQDAVNGAFMKYYDATMASGNVRKVVLLDSMHTESNMKTISRGKILFRTLVKFLTKLVTLYTEEIPNVSKHVETYLKRPSPFDDFGPRISKTAKTKRVSDTAQDLHDIIEQFKNRPEISELEAYKLMVRIFGEQCKEVDNGKGGLEVQMKPPKEVPSDSVQNPSDPDAGYSGYKGQGYSSQHGEIVYMEAQEDGTEKAVASILAVTVVEPANRSDAKALPPIMKDMDDKGYLDGVEEVLADAGYGSYENSQVVVALGKKFIAPVAGNTPGCRSGEGGEEAAITPGKLTLADFAADAGGAAQTCPYGAQCETVRNKKDDGFVAHIDIVECTSCPLREKCPAKEVWGRTVIRYTDSMMSLALRRRWMTTTEYRKKSKIRSRIEQMHSVMSRRLKAKHAPVRGLQAMNHFMQLKSTALNITMFTRFIKEQNRKDKGQSRSLAA